MIGMRWRASVLATVVGSLAVAATGRAADQLVLGDTFVLVNPGGAELRSAAATADERNAPATIVGDPTLAGSAGGAILTLIANGASPSSQEFVLPQGTTSSGKPFWRVMDGGFRYSDLLGEQGPVTVVRIRRTSAGLFKIESAVLALNGPVDVVPPNPGTDAFMTLKLSLAPEAGDRYCVQYGPESDITNDGPFFFSAKNPVEKGCPTTTTTTTTSTTTTLDPLRPCGLDSSGTCGGVCNSFFEDCVRDDQTGACVCVLGPCRAVGGIGSCGGTCPSPAICTLFPVGGCACIIPCATCEPACQFPQACVFDPTTSACVYAP
jgi:hypothetical protein